VESEKEKDNLLVLEAIRFLGNRGALSSGESSGSSGSSGGNSDAGGHEQHDSDMKQDNVGDGNVSENRDKEGLSGRFDIMGGREEDRIKKDDDVVLPMGDDEEKDGQKQGVAEEKEGVIDHPMEGGEKEDSGVSIPLRQNGVEPAVEGVSPNEEGNKDNTAPEESSEEYTGEATTDGTKAS
jgi:hypothetical protein